VKNHRISAVLTGVLYIIGTAAGILSVAVTGDLLAGDDFIHRIAANPSPLYMGAFFILIMGLSLAAMPIVLFPIFKKRNEALAMGMVVFRGPIEGSTYILFVVNWLLLGAFSKELVASGSNAAALQIIGNVMHQANTIMSPVLSIVFIVGSTMLFVLFYLTKLIPRWLSLWGLIGAVFYIAVAFFKFFDLNLQVDFLYVPLAVQEMVMALWLIIKGFNQGALRELMAAEKVKQDAHMKVSR
jgi:hypothetical protein